MSPARALRAAGLALLAALLLAPAAQARFPASVETTVAPGGTSTLGSPSLPPAARSATVDVVPVMPAEDDFFGGLQVVLSLQPTPGKRLMTCIGLYINVAHGIDDSVDLQFPEQVHPLAVLLLSACLEQAAAIDRAAQQRAQGAAMAAAACKRLATQVGATYTRVGRRYRVTIDGTPTRLRRRARLKVGCRRNGAGMTLRVQPTARGRTLRSVVGDRLRLGLYNPLDADGSTQARVTFRAPR